VAAQAALEVKASGKKLVVFGWENLDRGLHITQRLCRKITLRAADAIICGNQDGASLVRQWGYKGIIEVMPQRGIDPLEFSPALPKQIRRQAPNFTIGFVGRFVPEKGGDTLFQAFSMLIKKGRNVQLVMLGSGPEMENWRKLARELGIAKQVNWLDAVPHFEPNPEVSQRLEHNIRLNHFEDRVSLIPFALSDREGELTLYVPRSDEPNRGISSLYKHVNVLTDEIKVEVKPLDSIFANLGLNRLDFLKIDTDGNDTLI